MPIKNRIAVALVCAFANTLTFGAAGPFSGGPSMPLAVSPTPAQAAQAAPASNPAARPQGAAASAAANGVNSTWPSADPRGLPPGQGSIASDTGLVVMVITHGKAARKAFVGPPKSYDGGRWLVAGDPIPGRYSGSVAAVCKEGLALSTGEFIDVGRAIPFEGPMDARRAARKGAPC